jgi:hypothetical protein
MRNADQITVLNQDQCVLSGKEIPVQSIGCPMGVCFALGSIWHLTASMRAGWQAAYFLYPPFDKGPCEEEK